MPAKILVVDDETDIEFLVRKKFRRKIQNNEFDFSFAYNGVEALEAIEKDNHLDLVLTDINMPHMDGLTLIQKINSLGYGIKTVVVSAYDDMDNIRKAMNFGAFDFITKPIDFQDFEDTIYKTLLQRNQELKTENIELADALRELKETQQQLFLREKMASLGNLVAGIAHEINNPVGVVNSSADVVGRCIEKIESSLNDYDQIGISESVAKLFNLLKDNSELIQSAGKRIATIINSLKKFARLDSEEFQNADIRENIENILTLLVNEFQDRITVEKKYDPIPPIYCSPSQINQVLMCVMLNAAQAIEKSGTMKISTQLADKNVVIKISDDGRGIPEDKLTELFEFGFNRQNARVKMGLGLPISFHIIQKHNGNLFIDSKVDVGTEVTIMLPVA